MTLKALVRERLESGQDVPADLFKPFEGNQTKKNNKEKLEMSDAKQVATKKENLPSASLFEADAQAGFENVKTESLAPPILKLLQNGSAEAQKRNQNYVEGAEPGMFLNTVTKQLYDGDKGIQVIPCHYKLEYPRMGRLWNRFR